MADVACFCGCLYSFGGGAGACPRCGEIATIMSAAAAASTEGIAPPAPALREVRQNGSFRKGSRDRASDLPVGGDVGGTLARDPRTEQAMRR